MSNVSDENPDHDSSERKPAEQWATAKQHTWQFAAAKAFRQWPVGAEVTEKDYDVAVKEASEQRLGYSVPLATKPLRDWAGDEHVLLEQVRAYQGWPEDQAITEAEFKAAVALIRARNAQ
jgi:hypothetical protein